MARWHNDAGHPLADDYWLEIHHNAKLVERKRYAKNLAKLQPKSIVDLGCATGLWLDICNDIFPDDCAFIGIDNDSSSLDIARLRSCNWNREVTFLQLDLEKDVLSIPPCDLTFAFNIFSYIQDLDTFLSALFSRTPRGHLAIRQYDGDALRFGPMSTSQRQDMEVSLRLGIETHQYFKHYDMDRTIRTLHDSPYENCSIDFELFSRFSPYPQSFIPYYLETIKWTHDLLSDKEATRLAHWLKETEEGNIKNGYFYEVDLVALLS